MTKARNITMAIGILCHWANFLLFIYSMKRGRMQVDISFRLLRAFLLLSKHRNFTRAAADFHLSQSAFSTLIQRVEDAVGSRLFDRTTRTVRLTVEGEMFYSAAECLANDIQGVLSDMNDYLAKRKSYVSIAAPSAIVGKWLAPVIAQYRKMFPMCFVQLHDLPSDDCVELLESGGADIAFAVPTSFRDVFDSELFISDPYCVVCRKDHPLAARAEVSVDELGHLGVVVMARSGLSNRSLLDLAGYSEKSSCSFEVLNETTVASLVRYGLGVGLMTESNMELLAHPELKKIRLAPPALVSPIHIIKRRGQRLSLVAGEFLRLLRQSLDPLAKAQSR